MFNYFYALVRQCRDVHLLLRTHFSSPDENKAIKFSHNALKLEVKKPMRCARSLVTKIAKLFSGFYELGLRRLENNKQTQLRVT